MVNLANSPKHAVVLAEMRAALDEWIVASDDQGRFPEDPRVIAHYEALMRRNYDQKLEAARPAEHRRIFQLRYGERQSIRSIAEKVGKSKDAVKVSLRRSRAALLESHGHKKEAVSFLPRPRLRPIQQ